MSIVGYFDDPAAAPAHDPPLDAPCLVCWRPMEAPRVTVSLMSVGDDRSYFVRAHKGCWDGLSPEEQSAYESSIVDRGTEP